MANLTFFSLLTSIIFFPYLQSHKTYCGFFILFYLFACLLATGANGNTKIMKYNRSKRSITKCDDGSVKSIHLIHIQMEFSFSVLNFVIVKTMLFAKNMTQFCTCMSKKP